MAQFDVSTIASALSFIGSVCTIVVGVVFLIDKMDAARLKTNCKLFEPDCNKGWRDVFTLNPIVMLDFWTPVILGLLGSAVHLKQLRSGGMETFMPSNYIQYALLMLVTGLFGDFGYTGMAGVLVGALCVVASLCCVIAKVTGDQQVRLLNVSG